MPLCKCGWQGIPTMETADAWAQFDRHKEAERAKRGDKPVRIGRRRQFR